MITTNSVCPRTILSRRCGRGLTATASRERRGGPACHAFEHRVARSAAPRHGMRTSYPPLTQQIAPSKASW
jgi:hypothetical protein